MINHMTNFMINHMTNHMINHMTNLMINHMINYMINYMINNVISHMIFFSVGRSKGEPIYWLSGTQKVKNCRKMLINVKKCKKLKEFSNYDPIVNYKC